MQRQGRHDRHGNVGPPRTAGKVARYRSGRVLGTRSVPAIGSGQVVDVPTDRAA